MFKNFNTVKLSISSLIGLVIFIAIYVYYFWLAYTVPSITDDLTFGMLANLNFNEAYQAIYSRLKWCARIGEIFVKIMHHFSIRYYLIMPCLHIANLCLGYYLIKGTKLNVFNLSYIKELLVLFTLYTFLNSAPFQGIVWQAGTISNNFGLPFVLLFFIYIKKLATTPISTLPYKLQAIDIFYLLASYLAGWAQESVPAHILASAIFLCFYLHTNEINIIKYLQNKKTIMIAYILTACGWFSQGIVANFWTKRLDSSHDSSYWKFYQDMEPIPVVIKILMVVVVILLVYFFVNQKKINDKNKKIIGFIFVLTLLNLLTCLINIDYKWSRAFLYQSFIAGGILFYIYLNFIASNKNDFINKIIFIGVCYLALNTGFLLAYNTLLEKYRSKYVFALLEKNKANKINLPDTQTIPSKLFFSQHGIALNKLAQKNLVQFYKLSYPNPYSQYINQFAYADKYLKTYYPNTKINFVSYEEFIRQSQK